MPTSRTPAYSALTMQALNEDQDGDMLDHRTIFEEDRDFNQGAPPGSEDFLPDLACEIPD